MASMRDELNRALTRQPDNVTSPLVWDAYADYLLGLVRRAQATAWEEGRNAASRGVKSNPYAEELHRG